MEKFPTWAEALNAYRVAFNEGTLEVIPRAGGPFDNPLILDDPNSDREWEDAITN
jgi:hypothetical protein